MASLRSLHPAVARLAQAFLRELARHGIKATVTSTRRDPDQQARLWNNYQRCGCSSCPPVPGRCFPAARPGQSTHALGYAFDLRLDPPRYDLAGRIWESLGLTWGGRFRDPIHFDIRRRA